MRFLWSDLLWLLLAIPALVAVYGYVLHRRKKSAIRYASLTLVREDRKLSLDLRGTPEAAALVDSIRGTLAGDRAALERVYRLQLEGSAAAWALTLTPREPALAAWVKRIRIAGRRADVTVIEILHANGDSTLTSVQRLPAP